ncbi:hypothetical protein ACFQPF_01350 [Fictibacillus iocasae]|uniref:Uncharacterized protein n=1 Tax=Fictibacillus iocasae TaxID=2715437 RepID=A0ABW2NIK7_9BACL
MYTLVTDTTCSFTYDPKNNTHTARYKTGTTFKLVYFYNSGYDAVASTEFKVE